jgi:hypothetical protein
MRKGGKRDTVTNRVGWPVDKPPNLFMVSKVKRAHPERD